MDTSETITIAGKLLLTSTAAGLGIGFPVSLVLESKVNWGRRYFRASLACAIAAFGFFLVSLGTDLHLASTVVVDRPGDIPPWTWPYLTYGVVSAVSLGVIARPDFLRTVAGVLFSACGLALLSISMNGGFRMVVILAGEYVLAPLIAGFVLGLPVALVLKGDILWWRRYFLASASCSVGVFVQLITQFVADRYMVDVRLQEQPGDIPVQSLPVIAFLGSTTLALMLIARAGFWRAVSGVTLLSVLLLLLGVAIYLGMR